MAPLLTLITLGPVVVIALIVRNLVLGVAFGVVMLNMLLMVTSQDPERVALCVFLTLVVTVTYLASTRNHVVQSIKGRRWKEWSPAWSRNSRRIPFPESSVFALLPESIRYNTRRFLVRCPDAHTWACV